jgi:hypothetical protein
MGALIYVGAGAVWMQDGQPVPNRNLTAEEVELYGGERVLLKGGLYVKPPKKRRSKEEVEEVDHGSIE